jgi:hypothetical protein
MKTTVLFISLMAAVLVALVRAEDSAPAKALLDRLNAPEAWEKRSSNEKRQFMIDDYEKIPAEKRQFMIDDYEKIPAEKRQFMIDDYKIPAEKRQFMIDDYENIPSEKR